MVKLFYYICCWLGCLNKLFKEIFSCIENLIRLTKINKDVVAVISLAPVRFGSNFKSIIFKAIIKNISRATCWKLELISSECHKTSPMWGINIRWGFGLVEWVNKSNTWANVGPYLCRHVALLGRYALTRKSTRLRWNNLASNTKCHRSHWTGFDWNVLYDTKSICVGLHGRGLSRCNI